MPIYQPKAILRQNDQPIESLGYAALILFQPTCTLELAIEEDYRIHPRLNPYSLPYFVANQSGPRSKWSLNNFTVYSVEWQDSVKLNSNM